jgi:hypothetical protein
MSKLSKFDVWFLTGYAIVQLAYMLQAFFTKGHEAASSIITSLVFYFIVLIVVVGFASLRGGPPDDGNDKEE